MKKLLILFTLVFCLTSTAFAATVVKTKRNKFILKSKRNENLQVGDEIILLAHNSRIGTGLIRKKRKNLLLASLTSGKVRKGAIAKPAKGSSDGNVSFDTFENKSEKSDSKLNPLLVELGYSSSSFSSEDSDGKLSGRGINLGLGKQIRLSDYFSTTSSVNFQYISFNKYSEKGQTNKIEGENSITTKDLSFSQTVDLHFETPSGIVISPFLGANVGYGIFKLESEIKFDRNYLTYGPQLGVNVILNNDLVPYLKYDISKLKLSNSNTKNNYKTLTAGLGYRF